ncbi:C6 finger domain protein [Metarhizium acridum CQMa 102]|uniref:C6 finger domain protein n=1 Tax=Metarhizium acridum (strain CQMa 102) TaxID=655827 RepID=E9E5E8_METAQ|nr:C6 finger domain protein [Metarhizium acridum CQMa 102]EFY88831.1 C6 finger domain protein [Metarhizium acridum CQMa 102]
MTRVMSQLWFRCDETRPTCSACSKFSIPCSFSAPCTAATCDSAGNHVSHTVQIRPRGRGRPRKDWLQLPPDPRVPDSRPTYRDDSPLNLGEAELLLHFTQVTAQSLAGDTDPKDQMVQFWARNVPRIGLSNPFVLNLMYATAAYHLAELSCNLDKKRHYKSMAESHWTKGTAVLSTVMGILDDSNCGAAYIGATLLCYCSFAAGPSGPGDLLVCDIDGKNRWRNLVSGVRLIRESFPEDILFAGLMKPLGHSEPRETKRGATAACAARGLPRISWHDAMASMRKLAERQDGPYALVCVQSLDELALIYEGVYGDESGERNVSEDRQFVLSWLYRLDSDFVEAVRCQDTVSLLVLAYFAVLLATMEGEWWLRGWAQHLITSINDIVGPTAIQWPRNQVLRQLHLTQPEFVP